MRASLVAIVLVGAIALAVVAFRVRRADSIAGPLLSQTGQSPNPAALTDEPLASMPEAIPETSEAPAESVQDTGQADASGMTPREKLSSLLGSHMMFMKTKDVPAEARISTEPLPALASHPCGALGFATEFRIGAELSFTKRCVLTIMRESGRADYGDPEQLKLKGGFSLQESSPDEWVLTADRARYSFMKGEFPAYDMARARAIRAFKGEPFGPVTPEVQAMYDALFKEALASLDDDLEPGDFEVVVMDGEFIIMDHNETAVEDDEDDE